MFVPLRFDCSSNFIASNVFLFFFCFFFVCFFCCCFFFFFFSALMPELAKKYNAGNSEVDISKIIYFGWLL